MKSKVKIQVAGALVPGADEVTVWLDEAVRGIYVVDKRHTPIDEALILVGVERIIYDGEGDFRPTVTQTWESVKRNVTSVGGHLPRPLGEVRLTKVWLEAAEEYWVKVAIDGVEKGGTSDKLNYPSLRTILQALDFDVELVGAV